MTKYFTLFFALLLGCAVAAAQQVDSIPAVEPVDSLAVEQQEVAVEVEIEAEPEATASTELPALTLNTPAPSTGNGYMDHISPKYGYYTPVKEFSFTTVPLVAGGFIVKGIKKNFRRARVDFEPKFHNTMDNYTQYVPLAAAWGLKAFGVEGRSNWSRFVVSNVFSAAVMAGIVNGVKYSAKEMRPDGSTANSFPSGHTATAFMAATILHKEYGLTRSPWYSVGAYSLATMTGVMRSLNNRHWISDIMVGAGIGIVSTDLGYLFADLIFKDRGIVRTDRAGLTDIRDHASFFSGSLSTTKPFGTLDISDEVMQTVYSAIPQVEGLTKDNMLTPRLKMGWATTVNAEGAYFINPYVGFGGRLEVTSIPVMADNLNVFNVEVRTPDGSQVLENPYASSADPSATDMLRYFNNDNQHTYTMFPGHTFMQSVDNLPLFSYQLGVYGQLPVSRRCAFGGKLLVGRRIAGACDLDSYKGIIDDKYLDDTDWDIDLSDPDDLRTWLITTSTAFEEIDLDIKNSFMFTAGVNFTVLLRQNMGCKMYVDYSNSRFNYDLTYMRVDVPYMFGSVINGRDENETVVSATTSHKRGLNTLSFGVAVQLNF